MKTRKLLSLVLALAMSLMAMGVTALAEGEANTVTTAKEFMDAVKTGGEISLANDITLTEYIPITKNTTINGNDYTITSSATRILRVSASNITLTLNNINMVGDTGTERGLQLDSGMTGAHWILNDVHVSISKTQYYTINICNGASIDIEAKDSSFSGWGALNMWSCGYTADFDNCTFTGTNIHSGYSDAFGTIVLEGDTTLKTEMGASGNTVNFKDCRIYAIKEGERSQYAILFNTNSANNTVNISGGDTVVSSDSSLVRDDGTGNTVNITGGTYNADPSWYVANGYAAVKTAENVYQVGKLENNDLAETAPAATYEATYVATKTIVDESTNQTLVENNRTTVNVKAVDNAITTGLSSESFDRESIVNDVVAAIAENTIDIDFQIVRGDNNTEVVDGAITYEVHPEAKILVGNAQVATAKLGNDELAQGASFNITLPVPNELVVNDKVKVTHKSTGYEDEVGIYPVEDGYVTVTGVTHFSDFILTQVAESGEVVVSEFDSYKGNDGYWNLRAISQVNVNDFSGVSYYGTWFIPSNLLVNDNIQESTNKAVTYNAPGDITKLGEKNGWFTADLMGIPSGASGVDLTVVSFYKLTGDGNNDVVSTARETTAFANKNATSAE
ncbi:MAG: hypothetical protein IJT23_03170 [Clostridia bacterium]|nr:hypothetical protein [Clostridia bacterium]